MNLLSNYCRKNDIKTSITVGIVGKEIQPGNKIHFFICQDFQMLEKVV
jgi:hypothetical protein